MTGSHHGLSQSRPDIILSWHMLDGTLHMTHDTLYMTHAWYMTHDTRMMDSANLHTRTDWLAITFLLFDKTFVLFLTNIWWRVLVEKHDQKRHQRLCIHLYIRILIANILLDLWLITHHCISLLVFLFRKHNNQFSKTLLADFTVDAITRPLDRHLTR